MYVGTVFCSLFEVHAQLGLRWLSHSDILISVSCHLNGDLVQIGQNAMHAAAAFGCLEVVKFLSPMFGAKVHEMDRNGWTSLHHAANSGRSQVARYLIEELNFNPKDKNKVCVVLERRTCVQSAGSAYKLFVANLGNRHVMC